jgi:hypothetical protein
MNKTKQKLNILAYYQILGGSIGILLLIYSTLSLNNFGTMIIAQILLIFSLFTFSIFCGYQILKGNYLRGLNLSIYNNAIQVIGFGMFGVSWIYASGLLGSIRLELADDTYLGFFYWVSYFEGSLNADKNINFMSINIVAILVIAFIYKLQNRVLKLGNRLT